MNDSPTSKQGTDQPPQEILAELRWTSNRPELAQIYMRHLAQRAAVEIERLYTECRNWKQLHDADEACIADLQRQLREAKEHRAAHEPPEVMSDPPECTCDPDCWNPYCVKHGGSLADDAGERVTSIALDAAGKHAERVVALEAEASTLRESLVEVNRLLSLNVREVERLRAAQPPSAATKFKVGDAVAWKGSGNCQKTGVVSAIHPRAYVVVADGTTGRFPVTFDEGELCPLTKNDCTCAPGQEETCQVVQCKRQRLQVETYGPLDHKFLPDGMDPGICQKCGSTRLSHRGEKR